MSKEQLEEIKEKLNHIRGVLGLVGDQDTVNMAADLDVLIDEQAGQVQELEEQNKDYSEFLDNLIGRLYEYENQIIRYREAIKEASEIIKSLPRTYGKSRLSSVLVEALEEPE